MFLIHTLSLYNKSMHKLVGLNTLRFFAIVFIVAYHLFRSALPGGFIAVEIFFCISGFLIARKLINHVDVGYNLRYWQFIKSRLRRLYPTLFICVVVCLALAVIVDSDVMTGARVNTLTALTFTTNISELIAGGSYEESFLPNLFENTWFLALLFQLYLLLPLLFQLQIRIFRTRKAAIKFFGISLFCLGVASSALMACYGGFFGMADRAYFAIDSHMAAFCFGAAFAAFKYFVPRTPRTSKFVPAVGIILCLVTLTVLALRIEYNSPLAFLFALPFADFLAIVMLACIIKLQPNIRERRKTRNIIRIFESLGTLSFGVYLYHWPLYILLPHLLPSDTADWAYGVVNIVISILLAYLTLKIVSINDFYKKFRRLRTSVKLPYIAGAVAIIALAVVAIIRAPETSSIAEQLNIIAERNEEQANATAGEIGYISAAQVLDEVSDALSTQLQLAQDSKVLPAPSGSLAAENANSARVLVIGDSVTLGAKEAIEATISKSFVDARENRGIETATGIIAGYAATGKLPGIIVVSLATNYRDITEKMLQDIVATAGKGTKFIFVTAYAGPLQPRETQNAAIANYANKHKSVYVADWWSVSHDNWSLMYADHIHLNPEGRTAYANLLSNTIKEMQ